MKQGDFKDCVAVVTGGGSGIGLAVVKEFAIRGYYVYSLFRRANNGQITKLNSGTVEERTCDVTDENSIKNALVGIDRIDVLIHLAGSGICGSAEATKDEDVRFQMDVNFFGTVNVNRIALPIMRKRHKGLVIITSSVGGVYPLPFQGFYSASKFALEGYGGALKMETEKFGINVCVIQPGDAATPFTAMRKTTESALSPYKEMCDKTLGIIEKDEKHGYSAERVAKVYFKTSLKKHPPCTVAVGVKYKVLVFLKRIFPVRTAFFVLKKLYL